MFECLIALARAPVELAEAEVAVGDEWAYGARLGERQRLTVVAFPLSGSKWSACVAMSPSRVPGMGRKPGASWRGFDRPVGEAPRLVEPTKQQARATQRRRLPEEGQPPPP